MRFALLCSSICASSELNPTCPGRVVTKVWPRSRCKLRFQSPCGRHVETCDFGISFCIFALFSTFYIYTVRVVRVGGGTLWCTADRQSWGDFMINSALFPYLRHGDCVLSISFIVLLYHLTHYWSLLPLEQFCGWISSANRRCEIFSTQLVGSAFLHGIFVNGLRSVLEKKYPKNPPNSSVTDPFVCFVCLILEIVVFDFMIQVYFPNLILLNIFCEFYALFLYNTSIHEIYTAYTPPVYMQYTQHIPHCKKPGK